MEKGEYGARRGSSREAAASESPARKCRELNGEQTGAPLGTAPRCATDSAVPPATQDLAGNAIQVSFQELFPLTFKFYEHDAVAELGMACDHAPADDDGATVQP